MRKEPIELYFVLDFVKRLSEAVEQVDLAMDAERHLHCVMQVAKTGMYFQSAF
jgi:hypothetical protein